MKVVKSSMVVDCNHCNQRSNVTSQDFKVLYDPFTKKARFLEYTCEHCGKKNRLFKSEVFVHILREMNLL